MFRFRPHKLLVPFRFSQKLKSPQLSYVEKQRLAEEMDRSTNIEVLKRELFNDTLQLPIKFTAYYITNQQTFWAELIRSCIDATNHLILFGTNQINYGPNSKFPYGIEKIKNIVVLIPAALFLYFGAEITYESAMNIYNYNTFVTEGHNNIWALALYFVSIGIEVSVIFKNVQDAQRVDASPLDAQKSFYRKFMDIFQKKDPLLQAILYENAITLASTLVPLLSSVACMLHPSQMFEISGSLMIGLIQLNLGYHLFQKNIKTLIGEESLEQNELQKITQIIQSNEYVLNIQNEKAVMLGSRNFRFAAEITFKTDKINKEIIDDTKQQIERIIYTDSYKDREEYLQELLQDVQNQVMASLHQQIQNIEQAIRNEFPNCKNLDLEINQKTQADIYMIDDQNQLFIDSFQSPGIQFEKWMLEEADRLINVMKKKKDQTYFMTSDDYCKSNDYSSWNELQEGDEVLRINEDFRFYELQKELNRLHNLY